MVLEQQNSENFWIWTDYWFSSQWKHRLLLDICTCHCCRIGPTVCAVWNSVTLSTNLLFPDMDFALQFPVWSNEFWLYESTWTHKTRIREFTNACLALDHLMKSTDIISKGLNINRLLRQSWDQIFLNWHLPGSLISTKIYGVVKLVQLYLYLSIKFHHMGCGHQMQSPREESTKFSQWVRKQLHTHTKKGIMKI